MLLRQEFPYGAKGHCGQQTSGHGVRLITFYLFYFAVFLKIFFNMLTYSNNINTYNNNGYLERITHTGPKCLHFL